MASGRASTGRKGAANARSDAGTTRGRQHSDQSLIVDDQPVFREVAHAVLEGNGPFSVVAEGNSGIDAVNRMPEILPDVVTMDIQIGDMRGIEATRRIPGTRPVPA